jgi:hypothetical protein
MVILRLLDRGASGQANLGWDDVLIGLAGVSSIMQNVPVLVAANYGFGRDMWGMTPHEITSSLHVSRPRSNISSKDGKANGIRSGSGSRIPCT